LPPARAFAGAGVGVGSGSYDGYDREPSELQRLINSIPYRKLAVWGLVGLFLWPLHDFFGVSWWWAMVVGRRRTNNP
jgi:hypothetical protein